MAKGYEVKEAKNGRIMYFNNGKLISKDEYNKNAMTVAQVSSDVPQLEQGATKECIFCGEPATAQKFINLKTVNLCQEHYLEKTTGEVSQRMEQVYSG